MSYFKEVKIDTDNATGDAFGRVRQSQPEVLFDAKQIHDNLPLLFDDQEVSGGGTTSSWSQDRASTIIGVGLNTAGKRVRQSFQRFSYQAGKSQQILITGLLGSTGTDIAARMGYFDDDNGIFVVNTAGIAAIGKRTSITGSPVDTLIAQTNWNVDTLDGNGPSGITLDFDKVQILVIDFEWLGVGRVRVGFNVDGVTYVAHEFLHANNETGVYMSTPNLPIRYEIQNGGTGVASTMETICASVISEGGVEPLGMTRSANLGVSSVNANSTSVYYALLGGRLKSANLDGIVRPVNIDVTATNANAFIWELRINPTVAGTFTYNDVTNSVVQVALGDTAGNPSTNTVTGGTVIASGICQSQESSSINIESKMNLGSSIAGTPDEWVLCVRPFTSNADITGAVTWREI